MQTETTRNRERKKLISLIKDLPEKEIPVVKSFVEFIINKKQDKEIEEFLANIHEEEVSSEELNELQRLSKLTKKEFKEGKLIPFKKV